MNTEQTFGPDPAPDHDEVGVGPGILVSDEPDTTEPDEPETDTQPGRGGFGDPPAE